MKKTTKDVHELVTQISLGEELLNGKVIKLISDHTPVTKGKKKTVPFSHVAEQLGIAFSISGIDKVHTISKLRARVFIDRRSLHLLHLNTVLKAYALRFRNCISEDLRNENIVSQVWSLAVLGKVLTGPWMTKFYSSSMSNLEITPFIKTCVTTLKSWLEDPTFLCQPSHDVFGQQLNPDGDDVLSSLLDYSCSAYEGLRSDAMCSGITGALSVIERQLSSFLIGPYSEPSPRDLELTAAAPTHNMAAERTLGCFDKMFRRAPNARLGFINGKVKFKVNKVSVWLETKEEKEKQALVKFAIGEGVDERVRGLISQQNLVGEIAERRKTVSAQRVQTKKKAFAKELTKAFETKSTTLLKCSDSLKSRIDNFLSDPDDLIGSLVMHSFDGSEWYGRIQGYNKTAVKFNIGYWTLDEPESSAVDFNVKVTSIFSEAFVGAIIFV